VEEREEYDGKQLNALDKDEDILMNIQIQPYHIHDVIYLWRMGKGGGTLRVFHSLQIFHPLQSMRWTWRDVSHTATLIIVLPLVGTGLQNEGEWRHLPQEIQLQLPQQLVQPLFGR